MTARRANRHRTSAGGSSSSDPGSGAGPDVDPEAVARAIALRQLTFAPRTRAQLAQAMVRRGVGDNVVEQVLDRFEEVKLVDDAEFARQWVTSRHAGRGLARRALDHELRHRGVDDETVRAAVQAIDHDAELAAARDLVRRRLPSRAVDDPVRWTRRTVAMLARKGYGSGVALRAVREVLDDAASPGVDDGTDALAEELGDE